MKNMILKAILPGLLTGLINTAGAQKNRSRDNKNQEIIIMKNGDKDSKVTIETKDGKVYINGKPESEFKDDNISVITKKGGANNYFYAPGGNMHIFSDVDGEKKAFLGVTTESTDKGVKITDIQKGSAAEKAGLKEGDIITKVGNRKIEDPDELMDVITSFKPKEDVKVYYDRNGKSNDVKATLGEKTESMLRAFSFNGDGNRMNSDMLRNRDMFKDFNQDFHYEMPPMGLAPVQPFNRIWKFGNKRLGVRVEDLENEGGAKITNVEENSAAEKAGLKKDDIITEIEGKKIEDVDDVLEEVRESDKTSYKLKAKRNGAEMNFDVKYPKKLNNADL